MLDQMTHLMRLRTVVEEGSMRRAAARLHITQPALTRSIAQLEKYFGDSLLTRHSRGVQATDFGARVISEVSRLTRQWELAEKNLTRPVQQTTGTLHLRAGPLWRAVVLPDIITALQKSFPGLSIEVGSGVIKSTVEDIVEGRVDAVFGGIELPSSHDKRLITRQFTTVYDRVVAREDHPIFDGAANNKPINADRLLEYPWIVYSTDPVYELQTVHGAIERLGRAPDIRIRSESFVSVIGLLQKGDYLCILPEAAVKGANLPKIVSLPVEFAGRMIRSGIIFREEMADWPPLAELSRLCEQHFSENE
ncbi:LysR family transcriptional regulator [Rhizobium sp. L1K21]|uniref:LysR family transcriptional regulator n=1 Tax=Rhizobium sp. L1K21 TaxID=2954933 RepID=UPI0020929667|nr:LysR family transcriptional regulator [Rhizobium sp. L1K21]MCO6188535.1 LysR family transcriptional regulator [Rhizobium sp. L1K21]